MGYLPEAMRNYLARLGWSHGDDEIFSTEQAVGWFGLEDVGRSPSRFDYAKLENLNGHYIRQTPDAELVRQIKAILPEIETARDLAGRIGEEGWRKLEMAMPDLKQRAKTLAGLIDAARFLFARRPLAMSPEAEKLLAGGARARLAALHKKLAEAEPWEPGSLEAAVRAYAEEAGVKLGQAAQPLRAALTGRTASPGIFDVLHVLGREESLQRIADQAANAPGFAVADGAAARPAGKPAPRAAEG
jgi:glutamyl-tRNA synthetase